MPATGSRAGRVPLHAPAGPGRYTADMMNELFVQGLELMLVGMGTVFVFLTLLVLATAAMSRLVQRFEGRHPADAPAVASAPADESEEVAAIAAALTLHRRR